jgi:S1-C subfamily serine protease
VIGLIGLNETKGFLITRITKDSAADKYGLRGGSNTTMFKGRNITVGGDVILKIDNQSISKLADIINYVAGQEVGDKIHLTILRDNATKELDLTLGETPPSQELSSQQLSDFFNTHQNPEGLYDECVSVAGKSLCDFLFKK